MGTVLRYTLFDTDYILPESDRRKAKSGADLEDLTGMIYQVLKVTRPNLNFTAAFPPYLVDQELTGEKPVYDTTNIPNETITWRVVREVPASAGKERFGEPREYAPRLREDLLLDPLESDFSSHEIQVYGQWFEMILQFDCWAKTNVESEQLARFFRHLMNLSIPAFKLQGVKDMHFWARISDGMLERFPGGALVRSLQYYVRLEEITKVRIPLLKQINLVVETFGRNETLDLDVDRLRKGIAETI